MSEAAVCAVGETSGRAQIVFALDVTGVVPRQNDLGKSLLIAMRLSSGIKPLNVDEISPFVIGAAPARNPRLLNQPVALGIEIGDLNDEPVRAIGVAAPIGPERVSQCCAAADRLEIPALKQALGIEE